MSIEAMIEQAVARAVEPLVREVQTLREKIAPQKEWVSIKEAARIKSVSQDTIRRHIAAGRIEARGTGKMKEVRLV